MPKAISNTSPLLYLYRIRVLEWLPKLFDEIWMPNAVATELQQGRQKGLEVWGTLRVLLEAKSQGLTKSVEPLINHLQSSGMWISDGVRQRVLSLAGENPA